MIFIFGFAIVGLILCLKDDEYFFGVLFTFIMGLFGMMIACIATAFVPASSIVISEEYDIPIYAIQDNVTTSYVHKTYVCKTYSAQNDLNYFYLYEDEDGKGITFDNVPAKKSYLNFTEGEDEQPFVHVRKYEVTGIFKYLVLDKSYDVEYYFYIPEGSVTSDYNIDLTN
jgi:hypothetical protein